LGYGKWDIKMEEETICERIRKERKKERNRKENK
jgi:hypothetical protein